MESKVAAKTEITGTNLSRMENLFLTISIIFLQQIFLLFTF